MNYGWTISPHRYKPENYTDKKYKYVVAWIVGTTTGTFFTNSLRFARSEGHRLVWAHMSPGDVGQYEVYLTANDPEAGYPPVVHIFLHRARD